MEEYFLYHGRDGGPLAGRARGRADAAGPAGARPARHPRRRARRSRRVQAPPARPVRQRPPARPPRPARRRARRSWARCGRTPSSAAPTVTAEEELVEAVLDEVAAGRIEQQLDRARARRRGRAGAPRRGAVPPARARAALGGRARARLGRAARRDARGARRRRADRRGAPRARARRVSTQASAISSRALFNHLVTPSGTKIAHAVDDLARYADESTATPLEPVLGALEAARILRRVPGRAGGPPRYEIFHDVLAPAVLAWRARHEAERALERERAAARRRHRRLAVVAAVALVALAGTTALAAWALVAAGRGAGAGAGRGGRRAAPRRRASSRRTRSCSWARDPELGACCWRTHAARLAPSASTEDVLRRALRESRVRTVARLGIAGERSRRRSPGGEPCRGHRATAACGSSTAASPAASSSTPQRGAQTLALRRAGAHAALARRLTVAPPSGRRDRSRRCPCPPDTRFAAVRPAGATVRRRGQPGRERHRPPRAGCSRLCRIRHSCSAPRSARTAC